MQTMQSYMIHYLQIQNRPQELLPRKTTTICTLATQRTQHSQNSHHIHRCIQPLPKEDY